MLDSLSLNPFKFSDAGKRKGSPFGFHLLKKDSNLFDGVTGTPAVCSISGARWGIVNGVVAQFAANVPRIEDEGFGACPAFTQLAKYTEDLTNAAWGKVNSTVVLSPTFMGANIFKLVENSDTSSQHYLQQLNAYGVPADNSIVGCSFVAKAGERSKITIDIQGKNSASSSLCTFDLSNGNVTSHVANSGSIKALGSGYYTLFVWANAGVGTTPPMFRAHINNGATTIYNGDGVSGVYLGQPTYVNFGVNGIPFIPPYVPNNTGSSVSVVSEAATATTGTSFDLDLATLSRLKTGLRGPNAQGHFELEVESNVNSGWLASGFSINIITCRDALFGLLYYAKDTNTWRIYDGTNVVTLVSPISVVVGQTFRISLDYGTYTDGTQKMRLTVNGVKSSVVAFSGSFGTQDLKFFYEALLRAFFIKLGSFKFIPKPIW